MRRSFRLLEVPVAPVALLVTAGFSFLLLACAEKSPDEKVEAMRGRYSAELTNFVVMKEPAAEPMMDPGAEGTSADGGGGEEAVASDEGNEGDDELMEPASVEVSRDILLDILVQNTGSESLPGITVDVSQIDPSGTAKNGWKVFLELPNLAHGMTEQVSYVLEEVDYEEGDGFHAEVRTPVPPAERGDYAEF